MGLGDVWPGPGEPGAWNSAELRASRVKQPAEMIAIADTTADGQQDHVLRGNTVTRNAVPGVVHPSAAHSGGSNVLFCDGHVQWYRQAEITFDSYGRNVAVRRMWNYDNAPN